MKTVLYILFIMLSIVPQAFSAANLKTGTFTFGKGKKAYLFLPEKFTPGKTYKFILYLHGSGAADGSGMAFASEPYAKLRNLCSKYGYVAAVPSLGTSWFNPETEKDVDDMLEFLAEKLQMDLSRFHVMGSSMGAMSAMIFTARNLEKVISLCDIFGPFDMSEFRNGKYKDVLQNAYGGSYEQKKYIYESRNPLNYINVLAQVPVLIIHGSKDNIVKVEHSEKFYNSLKKLGSKQSELIIVPEAGHHNTIVAGLEKNIISFMEKYNQQK